MVIRVHVAQVDADTDETGVQRHDSQPDFGYIGSHPGAIWLNEEDGRLYFEHGGSAVAAVPKGHGHTFDQLIGAAPAVHSHTFDQLIGVAPAVHSHMGAETGIYLDTDYGWNGSQTIVTYDMSAYGVDVRKMDWTLKDPLDAYKSAGGEVDHPDADSVRVTVSIPLAAGTYALVGR